MKKLLLAFVLVVSTAVLAQRPAVPTAPVQPPAPLQGSIAGHSAWPVAKPEDVRSIDAIVNALYAVISGPKGQARDWDRMRSLFLPDAHLIPSRADRNTHRADAVVLTIDGYIERASPTMAANGFFERGIHNTVQQFGNIAHVWSTYESRHNADDAMPFARGINSIQLLKSGSRYYVVEVLWDAETPATPIPAEYLPK
ncbi:hypothetical protein [Edaphobacter flagellatus]|uniref:hypothetical protein n=1 Tax=Edaphobacter flagellatus TaxID=1933044 RepID=UPI0021B17EB8|nr:hypothetical protein [Edaphobacter flagellatus]